ncbi:MAG: response regulator [Rhodospirillaceae bacterium]|jgi:CheY-like chemotaxis protein|nr:response regulator [Rhodospirillales bacterium]MBT3906820.1 response regulator [Rhodospirillaceae bacterium]MBT4701797.1 response regulator [Rhodospirillaceae bacterium]MBT5035816.1 response regulator [Rhodospirillaceae bacterium]MBT6221971.1 response regulator [Rhodospirillaceae bacterium]
MAPKLEKILYAEDDADIRKIAVLAMEVLGGMTVETCESGVDVVEKALQFLPDLILLDVMMPNVDGPTALGQLRQVPELISIPVIFITAKVMKEEVAEFRELGAVDIIEKPFDPQSLTEKINEIWESTQK